MKGFIANIEKLAEENCDFRRVLYTGSHMQLVLMAIQSGEEIGEETHEDRDQFFRVPVGRDFNVPAQMLLDFEFQGCGRFRLTVGEEGLARGFAEMAQPFKNCAVGQYRIF